MCFTQDPYIIHFNIGVSMFGRDCTWCDHVQVEPAGMRWFEAPMLLLGLRAHRCPHCFAKSYRFTWLSWRTHRVSARPRPVRPAE